MQTSARNTKSIQNLQGCIFRILQHFATKLTILLILRRSIFLAVMMDFVLPVTLQQSEVYS